MRLEVAIATLNWLKECRDKHGWGFLPPQDSDTTAESLLQAILLEAGWADEDLPHTKAAKVGFSEAGLRCIELAIVQKQKSHGMSPEGKANIEEANKQLLQQAKQHLIYQPKAPKSELPAEKFSMGGRRLGKSKTTELAKTMAALDDMTKKKKEDKITGTGATTIIFDDDIMKDPLMIGDDQDPFLNIDNVLMEKFERKSEQLESFVENKDLKHWGTW